MQAPVALLRVHFGSGYGVHFGIVQKGVDQLAAQVFEQRLLDRLVTTIELDRHILGSITQRLGQGTGVGTPVTLTDKALEEFDVTGQTELFTQRHEQRCPRGIPGQRALRIIRDPAQYALELVTGRALMGYLERHRAPHQPAEHTQLHGPQPRDGGGCS
ncbi:hypothetical protein D3C79_578260 [compost metagenome]